MKFLAEIDCDNAAFGESNYELLSEVERILQVGIARIPLPMATGEPVKLYDINGNTVGLLKFED